MSDFILRMYPFHILTIPKYPDKVLFQTVSMHEVNDRIILEESL
jgi:hypothetical protein